MPETCKFALINRGDNRIIDKLWKLTAVGGMIFATVFFCVNRATTDSCRTSRVHSGKGFEFICDVMVFPCIIVICLGAEMERLTQNALLVLLLLAAMSVTREIEKGSPH